MESPRRSLGCQHHHKRSHDEMEASNRFRASRRLPSPPSPLVDANEPSGSGTISGTRQRSTQPEVSARRRFVGDGIDMRRPISSRTWNPGPNVIDLTEEVEENTPRSQASARRGRPPLFPGNMEIIDLSADASPADDHVSAYAVIDPIESPDIQMVSWQTRQEGPQQPQLPFGLHSVELDSDDEDEDQDLAVDDFEILEERPAQVRTPLPHRRAPNPIHQQAPRMGPVLRRLENLRTMAGFVQLPAIPMPADLNFAAVGFNLGRGRREPSPPAPIYDAPAPAPAGFTRSPGEDDTLICPNCKDELCTGDDETKRQVWVVRKCGHIYCGDCTKNRSKAKRKGKEPLHAPPAFSACVVDGCRERTVHKTAMIQMYL